MNKKQRYIFLLTLLAVSFSTLCFLTKENVFLILLIFVTLLDVAVFLKRFE